MNPRSGRFEAAVVGVGLCLTVYGGASAVSEFGNYRQAQGFAHELGRQDNETARALLEAYALSDRRAWVIDGGLATTGLAAVVVAGGLLWNRRREEQYEDY